MVKEGWTVRVGKGSDFIMIDLLSPDNRHTSFVDGLGAITLTRGQWGQLKKFIRDNPGFGDDVK